MDGWRQDVRVKFLEFSSTTLVVESKVFGYEFDPGQVYVVFVFSFDIKP